MTDSEFNVWFAATGYEWRGWPEWDDREFRMRLVPHGNESQVEWFIPPDMGRRNTAYRPTHEAACIIRDFLFFHPDMLRHAPVLCDSRSEMSDFLVESVKAVLKEGDGDAS